MTLFINTTNNEYIEIALVKEGKIIAKKKIKSHFNQGEKLLPGLEKLLKAGKIDLKEISKIEVNNSGGSFTSLRIGVVTANALAFALGIPIFSSENDERGRKGRRKENLSFNVVEPKYSGEPNITLKKKV